jgi:hypothetical protein
MAGAAEEEGGSAMPEWKRLHMLLAPLAGEIVLTLAIGFCLFIPSGPIDGPNICTIGFLGAGDAPNPSLQLR